MEQAIPAIVFQVFSILNLIYYVVSLGMYWIRRNTFPIKQRLPYLVLTETFLASCIGTQVLLGGVFDPNEDTIFTNCTTTVSILTILEGVVVTMMAFRITLICLKNLNTKLMVQKERLSYSALSQDQDHKSTFEQAWFSVVVWVLSKAKQKLTSTQIALLAVLPGTIISIVDIGIVLGYGHVPGVRMASPECQSLMQKNGILKVALYVFFGMLAFFDFISILQMDDNFSLGQEIRVLLALAVIMILLMNVTVEYAIFDVLVIQTAA
jgi:hypothetical protein